MSMTRAPPVLVTLVVFGSVTSTALRRLIRPVVKLMSDQRRARASERRMPVKASVLHSGNSSSSSSSWFQVRNAWLRAGPGDDLRLLRAHLARAGGIDGALPLGGVQQD